jgi:hypothetical protein
MNDLKYINLLTFENLYNSILDEVLDVCYDYGLYNKSEDKLFLNIRVKDIKEAFYYLIDKKLDELHPIGSRLILCKGNDHLNKLISLEKELLFEENEIKYFFNKLWENIKRRKDCFCIDNDEINSQSIVKYIKAKLGKDFVNELKIDTILTSKNQQKIIPNYIKLEIENQLIKNKLI